MGKAKKMEIVYLEPDEEIPSVISRLEETKSKKVVLVIPKEAILTHSIINLKLLQREAKKLKKQVLVVTADEVGQNLARKAGYLVYSSLKELNSGRTSPVESPRPEKGFRKSIDISAPRPDGKSVLKSRRSKTKEVKRKSKTKKSVFSRWQKVVLFVGSCFALIILFFVLYLYVPKTTVTLYLKGEEQTRDFALVLSPNPQEKEVKAEVVSKEIEKESKGVASGEEEIGAKAKGVITIYNYWDSTPQILVAQTRFQSISTNKIFRIQKQITVPGTSISQGQIVPGTLEVEVIADEVGAEYNIAPDKFIIPGLPTAKQSKIYAESKVPMSGGYKKKIKVVTESDCQTLLGKLKEEAKEEFAKEVKKLKDEDLVKRDDFVFEKVKEEVCSPAVGDEATAFTGRVKIEFSFFAFYDKDLKTRLKEEAEKVLSPAKELAQSSFSKMEFKEKNLDFENKKLRLKISTNLVLLPKLNLEALKSNLAGRSKQEAESYLNSFEEIEKAEVSFFPSFWQKISSRPSQIKVELKTE